MKLLNLLQKMAGNEKILIYDNDSGLVAFNGKMLDIPTEICIGGYKVTYIGNRKDFIEIDIEGK